MHRRPLQVCTPEAPDLCAAATHSKAEMPPKHARIPGLPRSGTRAPACPNWRRIRSTQADRTTKPVCFLQSSARSKLLDPTPESAPGGALEMRNREAGNENCRDRKECERAGTAADIRRRTDR